MTTRQTVPALAMVAAIFAGCQETPADASFGIDGSTLNCKNSQCDVAFVVDNQYRDPMKIRYRAVLSNHQEEIVLEFSDEIEIPARGRFEVAKTVAVIEQPERLRVTVTTLKGL